MKIIFTIVWAFILMSTWFATSTTILHVDDNSKTFKLKSIFYWLSIGTTLFAGYYLIN
jgi:hypothetical protein